MLFPKRRPVAALMRQSRSPSVIVACQGDTVGHGPGPSRLPRQLSLPEPPEAGQLLSMVSRLVHMAVGVLDPTARLSLI
jgi:hypothetical protein